jgi:hypothetical protein
MRVPEAGPPALTDGAQPPARARDFAARGNPGGFDMSIIVPVFGNEYDMTQLQFVGWFHERTGRLASALEQRGRHWTDYFYHPYLANDGYTFRGATPDGIVPGFSDVTRDRARLPPLRCLSAADAPGCGRNEMHMRLLGPAAAARISPPVATQSSPT